jgi:hypothetical protein
MKSLMISVLAMVVSSAAMADSLVPRVPMLQLSGMEMGYTYTAIVDNYGLLNVTNEQGKLIGKKNLSKKTLATLSSYAQTLSNADIEEHHAQVVCMMMMPASQSDLSVSTAEEGIFTGDIRLVLTEQGCWNSHKVFPTEEYIRGYANLLKGVLEVLVYESAKFPR